jgi:hypothetical protein
MPYIRFCCRGSYFEDGVSWDCFLVPNGRVFGERKRLPVEVTTFEQLAGSESFTTLDKLLNGLTLGGDTASPLVILRVRQDKREYYYIDQLSKYREDSAKVRIWVAINSIIDSIRHSMA